MTTKLEIEVEEAVLAATKAIYDRFVAAGAEPVAVAAAIQAVYDSADARELVATHGLLPVTTRRRPAKACPGGVRGCEGFTMAEDSFDQDTYPCGHTVESCPGCGRGPGDGVSVTCDDAMGCGHWRSEEEVNS